MRAVGQTALPGNVPQCIQGRALTLLCVHLQAGDACFPPPDTEEEQKLAVEDWEFEMADALNVIKGTAKTVNVTFHYEVKEYTEKIQLEILMRKLKRKDNFDHLDFLTQNKGDQVMVALGVPKWRGKDGKELLQCKHISKITYGKKVVFQMEM